MAEYQRQMEGKNLPPIWTTTSTARSPYLVNYRKSPLVLHAMELRIGPDKFMEIVKIFYRSETHTTPALLSIIQEVAGMEERNAFEELLAR